MTDFDGLLETATYCRLNDEKRPAIVGLPDFTTSTVCPEDLTKPAEEDGVAAGVPSSWFVRIVFDKLLDPTIEDLIPQLDDDGQPTGVVLGTLENTQPVSLKCEGAEVPYNGYYVPNGNRISWPIGPALYIEPLDALSAPTSGTCEVTILDKVHSKTGEPVPNDQRSYKFTIMAMSLRSSKPDFEADAPAKLAPTAAVTYTWTANVKTPAAVAGIEIFEGPNVDGKVNPQVCDAGGTQVADANILTSAKGTVLSLGLNNGVTADKPTWKANTTYRIKIGAGAEVIPAQGGAAGTFPKDYELCFYTAA